MHGLRSYSTGGIVQANLLGLKARWYQFRVGMEEPPAVLDATDSVDSRTPPLPLGGLNRRMNLEALENFRVRDLDTGETSWIEKSDEPGRLLRAQTAALAVENKAARDRSRERVRRPSGMQKRAQSDELVQKQSAALRSADHVARHGAQERERELQTSTDGSVCARTRARSACCASTATGACWRVPVRTGSLTSGMSMRGARISWIFRTWATPATGSSTSGGTCGIRRRPLS